MQKFTPLRFSLDVLIKHFGTLPRKLAKYIQVTSQKLKLPIFLIEKNENLP